MAIRDHPARAERGDRRDAPPAARVRLGAGTYSLPIKRAVRDAEGIEDGGDVAVTVEVI